MFHLWKVTNNHCADRGISFFLEICKMRFVGELLAQDIYSSQTDFEYFLEFRMIMSDKIGWFIKK